MSYNAVLEADRAVTQKTEILISDVEVFGMLRHILSFRDNEIVRHTKRTKKYVKILVQKMLNMEEYKAYLRHINYESIAEVMTIHDIGKIGICDDILFKPGRLTRTEFDEVKKHVMVGLSILDSILAGRINNSAVIQNCYDIIGCHHEWWDGTGYPNGLKGTEIPLSARIAAIADVYDALISERSYKEACSHEEAVQIIRYGSGSHFDPDIINCFLDIEHHFRLISNN